MTYPPDSALCFRRLSSLSAVRDRRRSSGAPPRWRGHPAATLLLAGVCGSAELVAQTGAPLEAVDRYLAAEVVRQRIPGLSAAVLRGDSVLLARGYGLANLEHRVPATESGSVGKQFTAALIQLLAREGRLGLDDPVRRHLPQGPAQWDRISYVLLGAIIRRVTGSFYGEVLRQRVFEPLGMRTARIISEREIVPNRSDGYQLVEGRVEHQEWVAPSLNTTADGSLYLTVRDLAGWAVALNHRRLPGPAELEAAWTPVTLRSGGSYPYGLGRYLGEQCGRRRIGHGGSWQGFRASIQRYPEFDLTVIVLANLEQAEPEAISYAVAGLLEPALAAAHLARRAVAGAPAPPRPIPALREEVATGRAGAATAALERFLSPRERRAIGELGGPDVAWSFLGCDDVARRGITRLGAAVARSCYARGTAGGGAHLVEVAYTGDWKAAFIDWYDF